MKRGARSTQTERRPADALPEPAGAITRARSRREFMRLMATGGAAMLAAPAVAAVKAPVRKTAAAAADTAPMRRTRAGEGGTGTHPMLPAELEKSKKFLADSLKTLRNYALPPGSAPAYLFRPLAQKSRRKS